MQHLLVLATALLAGAISFRCFNCSWERAAIVAFLTALSPEAAVASHAILSDTLYAAFVVGSTAFFLRLSRAPSKTMGSWVLLGLTVGASVLVRPAGYALACALGLMGFWNQRTRVRNFAFLGSLLAVLLSYSAVNYAHCQFFGITQLGGTHLFGAAARYLEPSQIPDPGLREALGPIYARNLRRMTDSQWVRYAVDGPMVAIARLYPETKEADQVMQRLSRQAIVSHPWAFGGLQVALFGKFFMRVFVPAEIYWQPEYRFFIYRGLDIATSLKDRYPAIVGWLSQPPELGRLYMQAFQTVLRLPPTEAQAQLTRLEANSPYRYDQICVLWRPFSPLFKCYGWLGVMSLIFACWQLRDPEKGFPSMCLLAVIVVHVVLTDLGGEGAGRYAVPLEPLIWVLLISGWPFPFRHLNTVLPLRKEKAGVQD